MNDAPLVHYDTACRALAEARRVDEAKDIRDKAVALAAYARQAKNTELLRHATEIRLRAERRAGELLAATRKASGGEHGGRPKIDGSRSKPSNPTPTLEDMGVTKTQSSKWQGLAALSEDKFEIRIEHAKARVEGMTTSAPSCLEGAYRGDNEWWTPGSYIEAAREVLGAIDLDPASHALAQLTVRAERFFTAADDGLARPWWGRVWLNPPYERALLPAFVDKLVTEVASGSVTAAILLTNGCIDTAWFQNAARASRAICLARGRIHFVAPSGDTATSHNHGQAFFYFGANDTLFERVFSDIGLIVRPGIFGRKPRETTWGDELPPLACGARAET